MTSTPSGGSASHNENGAHDIPGALGRGRRSGTGNVGLGRRHAGEVGMDQIEYVQDDESDGSRGTRNGKKYVGERAMLAEAQRNYPSSGDMKRSERIQGKTRKNYSYNDGRTRMNAMNFDNCDCLAPDCIGCHLPCKRCGDRRCGLDCRRGRRYIYNSVEIEGSNTEHFNPHHEDYQNQTQQPSDSEKTA